MSDVIDDLVSMGEARDSSEKSFIRDQGLKVISARGTEEGLVLRIDGRAEWGMILGELSQFLEERRHFLSGGELSLEWLDRMPTKDQSQELAKNLRENYAIEIVSRRKKPEHALSIGDKDEAVSEKARSVTIPLFENIEEATLKGKATPRKKARDEIWGSGGLDYDGSSLERVISLGGKGLEGRDLESRQLGKMADLLGESVFYDEEANAKVVFGTLRSGQRIETPFSLLVVGDVNPGADVIAGGDIVVFGNLRGTAHASAYNDEGSDRVIIALQMRPMQLRIGSVISRGSEEMVDGAEIARIEERRIIVEAFHPRVFLRRPLR